MRKIYKKELASKIPVIVYVSPDGARAASAGVWIGQAADVLAMAPQTNIGSSTPIDVGGGNIQSDLRRKVINDAAASLIALAAEPRPKRGLGRARRSGRRRTSPPQHALRINVIDFIAPTLPALLTKIDGYKTVPKGLVVHTAGAEITTVAHVALAADPRHAHRPEPDHAVPVARRARNRRRALASGPDLPGDVRDPLPRDRLLRPRRAADQLGRPRAPRSPPSPSGSPSSSSASATARSRWPARPASSSASLLLFEPAGVRLPGLAAGRPRASPVTVSLFFVLALAKVVADPPPAGRGRRRSTLVGTHGLVRRDGLVAVKGELWQARGPRTASRSSPATRSTWSGSRGSRARRPRAGTPTLA